MKKYYYLINFKVYVSDTEKPIYNDEENRYSYDTLFKLWLKSIKHIEISDFDLKCICNYLASIKPSYTGEIDITDLVQEQLKECCNNRDVNGECMFPNCSGKTDIIFKLDKDDDNFNYSINGKELISELDKLIEKCDIRVKEFSEVGMEQSMLSSMAMQTAYSNVKKLILEKSKII